MKRLKISKHAVNRFAERILGVAPDRSHTLELKNILFKIVPDVEFTLFMPIPNYSGVVAVIRSCVVVTIYRISD